MDHGKLILDEGVERCRSEYDAARQMQSRTNAAFRNALRELYILYLNIRDNNAVRNAFYRDLASQNMRISNKEVLLVAESTLFPNVLRYPDTDHKSDITKASAYADLINRALKANISPAEFVRFVRKEAKKKTAKANAKTADAARSPKGPPENASEPPEPTTLPGAPAMAYKRIGSQRSMFLDGFWFNTDLAAETAMALYAAKGRQQITVTLYTDPDKHADKVVTAITVKPWHGPSPDPKVPPIGSDD